MSFASIPISNNPTPRIIHGSEVMNEIIPAVPNFVSSHALDWDVMNTMKLPRNRIARMMNVIPTIERSALPRKNCFECI